MNTTNPFAAIGQGMSANSAANPYYGLQQAQGQMANQQYSAQQAQQAAAFNMYAQQAIERRDWRINGVDMTFKEFADTLYPESCAEKTHLYLKYSK